MKTTSKGRTANQASDEPAWVLAARHGTAQEAVVVALRKTLLLPLDGLLVVVREFLNLSVSRWRPTFGRPTPGPVF